MVRALVLGVMALLVAAIGVVAFVGLRPAQPQAAVMPPRTISVLVAAKPLRAGSLLPPGDIAARQMDARDVPPDARADGTEARNALIGAMLRKMLAEKQPIAGDDVLRPGDRGFLAAVLAPGTRAVSVAVDAVSGEAGLIWPGDRIDVILTQEIDGTDQALGHRVAGETVMTDARVIAVDQQLVEGGQATGLLDSRTPNSRTITLEVTPHDAARLAVAMRLGKLQVVLRAAEPGVSDTVAISPPAASGGATVWGGDVSRALGGGAAQRNVEVRLFQGTRQVESYKF